MSDRTERIADALRRADYMNWTAAEVAEKIDRAVERECEQAVAAFAADIKGLRHKERIYVEEDDYVSGFGDAKDAVRALLHTVASEPTGGTE